jgi:hypothetical protein
MGGGSAVEKGIFVTLLTKVKVKGSSLAMLARRAPE